MAGRDQIIDEMCRSEPGDPPAYIRLLPEGQQEEIRRAMGFAYNVARPGLLARGRGDV